MVIRPLTEHREGENVYPEVEKIMGLTPAKFPEEYETYQKGQIKWKNKTAWAREYLKRKGQLDGTVRGMWKITEMGRDRVKIFMETRKDPDEGLAQIQALTLPLQKMHSLLLKKASIK